MSVTEFHQESFYVYVSLVQQEYLFSPNPWPVQSLVLEPEQQQGWVHSHVVSLKTNQALVNSSHKFYATLHDLTLYRQVVTVNRRACGWVSVNLFPLVVRRVSSSFIDTHQQELQVGIQVGSVGIVFSSRGKNYITLTKKLGINKQQSLITQQQRSQKW